MVVASGVGVKVSEPLFRCFLHFWYDRDCRGGQKVSCEEQPNNHCHKMFFYTEELRGSHQEEEEAHAQIGEYEYESLGDATWDLCHHECANNVDKAVDRQAHPSLQSSRIVIK